MQRSILKLENQTYSLDQFDEAEAEDWMLLHALTTEWPPDIRVQALSFTALHLSAWCNLTYNVQFMI